MTAVTRDVKWGEAALERREHIHYKLSRKSEGNPRKNFLQIIFSLGAQPVDQTNGVFL
jgi:hypothetical protein